MHVELTEAERELVRWARVARIATVDADGRPHVVPVSPVLHGDVVLFATDEESAKVRNLRRNPHVAMMFDEYSEDWKNALRGVMVRGTARVLDHGPEWDAARDMLYRKYEQYEEVSPIEPGRSVIVEIQIESITDGGV
jgi:PPOX class probable F420-dependent enzyme